MGKFRVVLESNIKNWYEESSKNKCFTIFSDPDFLSNFTEEKIYGYILKGNEKIAYFSFTLKNNKCYRPVFVIHNGVILSNRIFFQKQVKRNLDEYEIHNTFVDYLETNFKSIDLALHPFIKDIRPYLWLNYHSPNERDKCKIYIRYTSYLNISDLQNKNEFESKVFHNLLELRKRNIKEARKSKVKTKTELKLETFLNFYKNMMKNQGITVSDGELTLLENIIKTLVEKGKAKMFISYYKEIPIYITIWGWDRNRAYYLYGAGNQDIKLRFKGTINFWDAILYLAKVKKIKIIDWEGVNSPKRGFFKISFGGNLLNYYWIKKG